jgi:hypothetical protein
VEENTWDENDTIKINYDVLVKDKRLLAVTRLLAASLLVDPYTTVQNFLIGLNDNDLQKLLEYSEADDNGEYKNLDELILISEMLAQAEGLPPGNLVTSQHRINTLCVFLAGESLARKGLVKIYRENMSFGDDMNNKIVMGRI